MKAKCIVADSGGTSTKWMVVLNEHEQVYLETRSLHPRNINNTREVVDELRSILADFDAPVFFYGAGCSSTENQDFLKSLFREAGMRHVEVHTDILGVCRGLCGNEPGIVAILGTGSVLANYDGQHIVERYGGYGAVIGDEGSGMNFGKLVVKHALQEKTWEHELTTLFDSREKLLGMLSGKEVFTWLSTLPLRIQSDTFDGLHHLNFEQFVALYFGEIPKGTSIHVSGSYGFHKHIMLNEVLLQNGYHLGKCVQNPLAELARYHLVNLM